MIMTKFEKIETGLIIIFEVVLCTLKYGNKFINSTISEYDDGKIK